jgi:hypothetical protein
VRIVAAGLLFAIACCAASAQTADSLLPGTLSIKGYADVYFGYDDAMPAGNTKPYFVSANRVNEFNLNLAYVELTYTSPRIRAELTPAVGTYMNANYAAEPPGMRNLLEAWVGVKPFARRNVWLDVGVFSGHYSNETAISRDQVMYTRSLAAEYVPYYTAGARLTLPLTPKTVLYLFLLNGWQKIQRNENALAFGSQLEYKPDNRLTVDWNTYIGDERSAITPANRMRYFSDVWVHYTPSAKWALAACLYAGLQQRQDSIAVNTRATGNHTWGQANIQLRYWFTGVLSLSGRLEYFTDPARAVATPITDAQGFNVASAALCLNYEVAKRLLLRAESRTFYADRPLFVNAGGATSQWNTWLVAGMSILFER